TRGNTIHTNNPETSVPEGDSVELTCKYTGSDVYLLWYRQYPGRAPHFIIYERLGYSSVRDMAAFAKKRFSLTYNTSVTVLSISDGNTQITAR
ncbi:UNVERIFIED_CONTAM: hypothetical protein FKN15_076909, partial [Acipenser sinensis]